MPGRCWIQSPPSIFGAISNYPPSRLATTAWHPDFHPSCVRYEWSTWTHRPQAEYCRPPSFCTIVIGLSVSRFPPGSEKKGCRLSSAWTAFSCFSFDRRSPHLYPDRHIQHPLRCISTFCLLRRNMNDSRAKSPLHSVVYRFLYTMLLIEVEKHRLSKIDIWNTAKGRHEK